MCQGQCPSLHTWSPVIPRLPPEWELILLLHKPTGTQVVPQPHSYRVWLHFLKTELPPLYLGDHKNDTYL